MSNRKLPVTLLMMSAVAASALGCAGTSSTSRPAMSAQSSTTIVGPRTEQPAPGAGVIYVSCDCATRSILAFRTTDSGNVKPFRVISGSATMLNSPAGLAATDHMLFVADYTSDRILGFSGDAHGNVAPSVAISCAGLDSPYTLTAAKSGELNVLNAGQVTSISIIPPHANGCVTSYQQLVGDKTLLQGGNAIGIYGDRLAVLNFNNYITEYKADASDDAAPKAKLVGPDTKLMDFVIGPNNLAIDSTGTLYAANGGGNGTTEYLFGQTGDQRPIREIFPIQGMTGPTGLAVDDAGYLYALTSYQAKPAIAVYAPGANGEAQPIRMITGSSTELPFDAGIAVKD